MGPIDKAINAIGDCDQLDIYSISKMLIMVIKNPIQLTIVNAVPFTSEGALCASKVENNGESAMATIPHIRK